MNPGRILASMTGMALLAALAWHQVREKPHLQLEQDDSMLTGTILDKSADELAETGPAEPAAEDAVNDACAETHDDKDPEAPCIVLPEEGTASAEDSKEGGV